MSALRASICVLLLAAGPGVAHADYVDDLGRTLLTDPSYKVRTTAAVMLGKKGDARSVKPLMEALKDDNEVVRATAASSLGKLGDKRALDDLKRAQSDPSKFVRDSVEKALAVLGGPATGGARFYLTVSISGKAPVDAVQAFHNALTDGVSRLQGVTIRPDPSGKRLSSYALEGNITNLKVTNGQLDCDVSIAITQMPSHSIKATASAGASIPGVKNAGDRVAQRDCLGGAAQQVTEEVQKFLLRAP